ncbi:PLDc_N domain-containing protein [Candidatus Woesearchaeota archaeon]|nr:PLDc_N domain-containing protein [Candidatus Woesearchaeota archaeon]
MTIMLFFIAVFALLFVFWVVMLIDCIKRSFKNENEKIVWVLVIIFLHIIGAIIYFFVIKIGEQKRLIGKGKK